MSDAGFEPPVPGAPSDQDELRSVLARLGDAGWDTQVIPDGPPGSVRCGRCGEVHEIARWAVDDERRLEGASDPADMVMVVALTCPACGARGAIALGYGPDASAEDSDLVVALPTSARRP